MFNWMDIVIVIIVLYNVIRGFSLGFIRSVIGIIGYVVAFIVSKQYHEMITTYCITHFKFVADVKASIAIKVETLLVDSITEGTTALTQPTLSASGIPFLEQLDLNKVLGINETAVHTAQEIGSQISNFVMNGLGAVVVFLLVLLVIKVMGMVLNAIMELPILKGVNRFAGLLVGLIKGTLFVFTLMTLLAFLSPSMHDTQVMQTLYQSKVGIVFYNNNIMLALIKMYLLG